jgi:hypothetical protein
MRLAKRKSGNRSGNKTEEDARNEGFEEDAHGRRPTFSNRRIHPVFGSALTVGGMTMQETLLRLVGSHKKLVAQMPLITRLARGGKILSCAAAPILGMFNLQQRIGREPQIRKTNASSPAQGQESNCLPLL